MSSVLTKARQQLTQVRVYLKQDKYVPAAQAVQFALGVVLKTPLMKAEREEFERLIGDAVQIFANHPGVRQVYPIQIRYVPGEERALNETMTEIVNELSHAALEEAQAQLLAKEQKKKIWLQRGAEELKDQPIKGQATLAALVREYPDDPDLKAQIGEMLLKAELYEQAVNYLTEALDMKPEMLPYYNVIGIALRKLSRFATAETYFLRASEYLRRDPNLYFNLGRLYVDWQKWDKAIRSATVALTLDPNFEQAAKLLKYAEAQAEKAKAQ